MTPSLPLQVIRTVQKHLGLLVALQLPIAIIEPISALFGGRDIPWIQHSVLGVTLVLSGLTSAATFVAVRTISNGEKATFVDSYRAVFKRLPVLLPASLFIHGALFLILLALNFLALLGPAPLFLALYAFTPMIILDSSDSLFVCLHRATVIARQALGKTFLLIFGFLLGGSTLELLAEWGGTELGSLIGGTLAERIGMAGASLVAGVTVGALIDITLSHYYIKMTEGEPTQ